MFRNKSWIWWAVIALIAYFVWRKFGPHISAGISKVTAKV